MKHGQRQLTQSLAILEYLDEVWPTPPLLPATARERHRVRALAQLVACDIHPLNNLRVLQYFEHEWNLPAPEREQWVKHWIMDGFSALETMLAGHPSTGEFLSLIHILDVYKRQLLPSCLTWIACCISAGMLC